MPALRITFAGGLGPKDIHPYSNYSTLGHSAGPLAFGLQAQSRGCVKLVGAKVVCVKAGWSKSWFA